MKYIYKEIDYFKRGEFNESNSFIAVLKDISYLRYLWLKLRGYHCIKVLNEVTVERNEIEP